MADHHQLTGRFAVHPFAFVQTTDPALDIANQVGPGKAWIDTASGNALKVRNPANTAWLNVLSGATTIGNNWTRVINLASSQVVAFPTPIGFGWTQVNYIP